MIIQNGKLGKLNIDTEGPLKVEKPAASGTSKVQVRSGTADDTGDAAGTEEYTFGFEDKDVLVSYRFDLYFLQDLICTYPEDAYTNVQYSIASSGSVVLYKDTDNELGYGEGRIYVYNPNKEIGTSTITATLMNGDDVVASDSYTLTVIADFGFSETSATATLGKPFTAPTLTNWYGSSVTYSSSHTNVATVDGNGDVTPVGVGYTTISAVLDESSSVFASYGLSVKYPYASLPYEESFTDGKGDFFITSTNIEESLTDVWTHDDGNLCMTATGKTDGTTKASESWLVSPCIYIGGDDIYLAFEQAVDNGFGDIDSQATLWIREMGWEGEHKDGEWEQIAIAHPVAPEDGNLSGFETQTFNLTAYLGKNIQFAFKYTSNAEAAGTWSIKNVSVEAEQKIFAFSTDNVTVLIGEKFTPPTLTNEYGDNVVYSSSDESVATVDANTGEVTIVGPGETRILAESDGYNTAYYDLTVIKPSATLPYDESFSAGKGIFIIDDVVLGDGMTDVWTHDSGNLSMMAAATVDGVGKASESWLISPLIAELSSSSYKYILSFEQAVDNRFGDIDGEATLWVREEGGEWENIAISHPEAPADGTLSEFVSQDVNILKDYSGKKIQFAFKYKSSADAAGTWFIRNVSIKSNRRTYGFVPLENNATIGEEFETPSLVVEYENYEVVGYRSDDTNIATVDETTGKVTLINPGRTRIRATLKVDGSIRTASYWITVSGISTVNLPYVESFVDGKGMFTIDNVALGEGLSDVWTYEESLCCMKATSCVDGIGIASESNLVSPIINATTDQGGLFLSFDHAINVNFGEVESEATLWVREEKGEWAQLPIEYPQVGDGFKKQMVDISEYIGKRIQIAFKYIGSEESAGTWCVKNVLVLGADPASPGIFAYTAEEAEATYGKEFDAPKLMNTYDGTVYYETDNKDVATVDENGVVTLVGPGETVIVAFLDGEECEPAYYVLRVTDPVAVGLPYEESFAWGAGRFAIDKVTLGDGLTNVWTNDWENQCMKAAATVDGVSVASESWLVSPVISRKSNSYYNVLSLSFDQAMDSGFGNAETEATLWAREENGKWEQVAIDYPSASSDDAPEFERLTVDLSRYAGKRMQFAFKYTSSAETAGTWRIKSVSIMSSHRDLQFAFSRSEVEATIGEEFVAPTLINDYEGGTVTYISNNKDVATVDRNTGEVTLVGPGTTLIIAYLQRDNSRYYANYTITVAGEPLAYYRKVTSTDELTDGGTYIIINEESSKAMAPVGNRYSAPAMSADPYTALGLYRVSGFVDIVVERQQDGSYALRNKNGYVGCDSYANFTEEPGDASEAVRQWTIGFTSEGDAEIRNVAFTERCIRFDATEPAFRSCYSGVCAAVQLYRKAEILDADDRDASVNFRAVGNDGAYYATFSYTENVVFPGDVEVKTVTVSDSKMRLEDVRKELYVIGGNRSIMSYGHYVPKGNGVLLRSAKASTPLYVVSDDVPDMALDENNMMRGVERDGIFEAEEGYRYYKLAYDDYDKKTDLGFYYGAPDGGAFEIRLPLAYLAVPESAMSQTSQASTTHFVFGDDGDVTTIRDIEVERNAKDPVIYNMAGQRVNAIGQPGVYIVNGKKVVVK